MREDANGGSAVGVLLGIILALVLGTGGAAFYVFTLRQQAAVERAVAQVEMAAAAEKNAHAQQQRAEAAEQRVREVLNERVDGRSTNGSDQIVRDAIKSVLRTQQQAWNRGDVDAFVAHYWKSGDLTFSSGGKTARGFEEAVRGYRERYPTPEAMGKLTFTNLEVTSLGRDAALVLGEWQLDRDEPLSGNFSVVFRKIGGKWVIVHDHTSRAGDEKR